MTSSTLFKTNLKRPLEEMMSKQSIERVGGALTKIQMIIIINKNMNYISINGVMINTYDLYIRAGVISSIYWIQHQPGYTDTS